VGDIVDLLARRDALVTELGLKELVTAEAEIWLVDYQTEQTQIQEALKLGSHRMWSRLSG